MAEDEERARDYMINEFPCELLYAMFGGTAQREYALEKSSGEYRRYNSFASHKDMLRAALPSADDMAQGRYATATLHVGPLYRSRPSKEARQRGDVHMRELAFDIDAPAYDDVRRCCGARATVKAEDGRKACERCWPLVAMGLTVLDVLMRRHFGMRRTFAVFSGGKGGHLWTLDDAARVWGDLERESVAAMVLAVGRAANDAVTLNGNGFASVASRVRAWHELDGVWLQQPAVAEALALLESCADELARSCGAGEWYERAKRIGGARAAAIALAWPRIDAGVTRQTNRLLKVPFSLHAGTRRPSWVIPLSPSGSPATWWREVNPFSGSEPASMDTEMVRKGALYLRSIVVHDEPVR